MHVQFLCKVLVVRTESQPDGSNAISVMFNKDLKLFKSYLCSYTLSFSFLFFPFIFKMSVEQEGEWGDLWLFWTLCRWMLTQYIVISVSYELLKTRANLLPLT